jgi:uncharacterized caspase-like protein
MTLKLALLIGNSQYQDPILAKLKAPDSDISELAKILQDPAIGGFDQVTTILSEVSNEVRAAIGDFFAERKRDDLLLLYFSGHGVLDENGYFYLAVKDTQHNRLRATGISASFIKEEMENCRSSRQVLVLDSCHSGAFARGKGAVGLNAITRATFEGAGGYGHVVLTATDATQYAWEGDQIIGNVKTSLFTHFLIEGLRTGQADSDRDGRITLDEIYDYVYEQVRAHTPHQTPRKWEQAREGEELVIAHSRYRPTDLPLELRQAIESTFSNVREGAVRELAQLLRGSDKSLMRLARGILKVMAKEDDSQRVRSAALTVLKSYEETKSTKATPRQENAAPILSIPPQERTSPSKPIPRPAKVVPAPSTSNTPRRNWLLWGGMSTGVLISIILYIFGSFLFDGPFVPISTNTPTLTIVLPSTEMPTTAETPTSAETGTPTLPTSTSVITDTPTITPMSPTSTLVPTTVVPSNTPTNTPTPTQVPPTRTPTMTSTTTVTPTRTPFTGNIASQGNRSRDGIGSGNAFDGNLSTFWTDGLGHRFTLTLSLPGSFDVNHILVWDRPQNSPDNQQINQLIISLSNGWSKRFDMNSGGPRCIDVTLSSPQAVTSVTLIADDASGNNGLSEVEIWVGSKTGGPTCSNSGTMP